MTKEQRRFIEEIAEQIKELTVERIQTVIVGNLIRQQDIKDNRHYRIAVIGNTASNEFIKNLMLDMTASIGKEIRRQEQ